MIEAEHFNQDVDQSSSAKWEVLPDMGRTLSGVAVRPYTESPEGAVLRYAVSIPDGTDSVRVHVVTKSTLAFQRKEGHRYTVGFEGGEPVEINFNSDLNEDPQNIYNVFYPTVARRVVEKSIPVKAAKTGETILEVRPLDPGIVFEKIVIDLGGYEPAYLFGKESNHRRVR